MTKEEAILAIPGVTYRKWIFGRESLLGQSSTDNDNDEHDGFEKGKGGHDNGNDNNNGNGNGNGWIRWLPWSVIRLSHENTDHCQQRELMLWCEDCTPQYYDEDGGDGIDDLMCIWQPWGQDKALLSLKPSVSDHSWPQHALRWQPPHPPDMRPPQLEILLEPSVFVSLAALSWTSTLLRCLSHFWLSVIARCFQK